MLFEQTCDVIWVVPPKKIPTLNIGCVFNFKMLLILGEKAFFTYIWELSSEPFLSFE
jgi:hypothetical protein